MDNFTRLVRYRRDSALHYAIDPLDWQRRELNGLRIQAQLHKPRAKVKPDNILRLARVNPSGGTSRG